MIEKLEPKTDCFAYVKKSDCIEECTALNDMYCRKENCKFYKKRGEHLQ